MAYFIFITQFQTYSYCWWLKTCTSNQVIYPPFICLIHHRWWFPGFSHQQYHLESRMCAIYTSSPTGWQPSKDQTLHLNPSAILRDPWSVQWIVEVHVSVYIYIYVICTSSIYIYTYIGQVSTICFLVFECAGIGVGVQPKHLPHVRFHFAGSS